MKKVIVHIGMHKTGTSSLQSFLRKNAATLSGRGYFYRPTSTDWPNHNPLAAAFLHPGCDAGPNAIREMLDASKGKTLLISSEMLLEAGMDLPRFMACFKGCEVTGIAYVRHPVDIYVSAYKETVCEGSRAVPIDHKPNVYDPVQFSMLRRWLDLRPAILAPYDAKQWRDRSLLSDFLSMLGLPSDGFDFEVDRENRSLPFSFVEIMRRLNAIGAPKTVKRGALRTLRKFEMAGRERGLPEDMRREFLLRMKETIPLLEPHFRPGFDPAFLLEPR